MESNPLTSFSFIKGDKMQVTQVVLVPLSDVLEHIGVSEVDDKIDTIVNSEKFDEGVPDSATSFEVALNDEDLLFEVIEEAGIDKDAFKSAIETISNENNGLPVFVTL